MAKARTLFRRMRTLLWTALTLLTILAAIVVGIGKLLMPYSGRYQPQLEEWLSREFDQPVSIEQFSGDWKAFGPRISLEGLTLLGDGQGEGDIAIKRAALDIKPFNLLLPNRPLYSFHIIGADLSLVRTEDGRYVLSGLGVSGRRSETGGNQGLKNLASVGEVSLEDSSLSFDDPQRNIHLQLSGIRARLQLRGQRLATELEANIAEREVALPEGSTGQPQVARVLGDIQATLLIRLDDDQRLEDASWHVKAGEMMISELVRQFPEHALAPTSGWLNAEAWGQWSKGQAQVMQGVIDLREAELGQGADALMLEHLNTRFNWTFTHRKDWRMDLSNLSILQAGNEWETAHMSLARKLEANLGLWVSSDFMEMEFPLQLTQLIMNNYKTRWPNNMPRGARGRMHEFDLVLDSRWKLYQASGRLDQVDAWDWGKWPDVSGIDGSADLLAGEGQIDLDAQAVRLDWPRNFRAPAQVDINACRMEILWGLAWQVDVNACQLRHRLFALNGRARFAKSTGKPVVDINAVLSVNNVAELDDFWPASVMSENVIDWLSDSMVAGQVSDGRLILRGDMDQWPFTDHSGKLSAQMRMHSAELDYYSAWPRAKALDLQLGFEDAGMRAEGRIGDLGGLAVDHAVATVDNFRQPVLQFDYRTGSELNQLLDFVGRTPMLADSELDLSRFVFDGPAETSGRMRVPLKKGGDPLSLNGLLTLSGNRFTESSAEVVLDDLRGEVRYSREGLTAEGIQTRYADHEALLGLQADWDAARIFQAGLQGEFDVSAIIPAKLLASEPMLARATGRSNWQMDLGITRAEDSTTIETWLDLHSDLVGVALDFPAPLDKASETAQMLHVRYPIKAADRLFRLELSGLASLQYQMGEDLAQPVRANIHFGPGLGALPAEGTINLDGHAAVFDLDHWMDLVIERLQRPRDEGALEFEQATLASERLLFLNREFADVALDLKVEDDVLKGQVDGAAMAGSIRYQQSDTGAHSLSAEMDRLFLPEPINEGMSMDTDPADLPEMHFYAREFSYMGLQLGETRIEAYPIQNGLRIDSVEAHSPQLNFQARGDWISDAEGSRSDFNILLTSESLGTLMQMLDISSVLEGGQTVLRYDAWWPGPPAAFALARLNGEMNISVVDGRILNADAGAGRMVGLLSIAALPRRLALDFRDVFESGFNFDQANGSVTLENGSAYTGDLVLESTAASMSIQGSSDLVEQQFDYIMSVRPGVGQTLPAIGAVIGGPGGAAAGLALQGLFQRSLGEAAEARYSITGPWSEPVVEPIEPETNKEAESVNE